jgi:hypothetical protein
MTAIPVLSPSGLRLWDTDKALFILKYVYQTRSEGSNIYAIRGVAVESGINKNVRECPQRCDTSIALNECLKVFDEQVHDYKIDKETAREFKPTTTGFITRGLVELSNLLGGLEGVQSQIEIGFELHGVQMRGYIDYLKGDKLVDLKCVNKLPTIVSRGPRKGLICSYKAKDVLQVCIYKMAVGLEPTLMYISEHDSLIYPVTLEEQEILAEKIKNMIEDIKMTFEMPHEEMLKYTRPDKFDEFFWDGNLINAAKHIWSL